MGARPRINRNTTYDSNPDTDFDAYDMFDSPERKPRPCREVRKTRTTEYSRHTPRDYREYREAYGSRESREYQRSEIYEELEPIADTAKIMKSLNYIHRELDYLRTVDIVSEEQIEIIMEQLPEDIPVLYAPQRKRHRRRRRRSNRSKGESDGQGDDKSKKKKMDAYDWVINVAKKFGNSAMFGAGATFAGDIMKHAMKAL